MTGWHYVDAGLELLDTQDRVTADISEFFESDGSSISSDVNATIHRTASLRIATELDWGKDRVRPYVVTATEHAKAYLTDDDGAVLTTNTGQKLWTELLGPDVQRVDLGVYTCGIPEHVGGESPATWQVECFDKIELIRWPLGQTLAVPSGANYTDAALSLLQQLNVSPVSLSQVASALTLPAQRVWPVGAGIIGVDAVNELLAEVNYRSLYANRAGTFRAEPDVAYSTQAPVATISGDVTVDGSWMSEDRTRTRDQWVPNRFIFIRTDSLATAPVEGAGIYIVDDVPDQQRRGRVIAAEVPFEVESHSILVERGDQYAARALAGEDRMRFSCPVVPEVWHDDVVSVVDPDTGAAGNYRVTSWSLSLADGEHEFEVVSV